MSNVQFGILCAVMAAAAAGYIYLRAKGAQDQPEDPVARKRAQKGAIVRTVIFGAVLLGLYFTRGA